MKHQQAEGQRGRETDRAQIYYAVEMGYVQYTRRIALH
jgi:hypothetical protein